MADFCPKARTQTLKTRIGHQNELLCINVFVYPSAKMNDKVG